MNIYHKLNTVIDYIESNLDEQIEYKKIAQILEMNEYTAQTAFCILADISIADYIRKRRLSNAGYDLYNTNETIMQIAVKYQYTSATSFSRAFEKFHGIKPSTAKQNMQGLKLYSRLYFNEDIEERKSIEYSIETKQKIILYGVGEKTDLYKIKKDAPQIWVDKLEKYQEKYGEFNYGMTSYVDRFGDENCEYWVLYDKKIDDEEFKKVVIPASKWIVFRINSQETEDIQNTTRRFYKEFLPSSKYRLREIPELEYYHDDIVEFMIPIED